MRLYVIRHAPREPSEDFADDQEGDPEAPITEEGHDIAAALGKWMVDNDEVPSRIVVSPTVRANQTAECIAAAIEEEGLVPPAIEQDASIGPQLSVRGLVNKLADDDDSKRVAVVSHHQPIVNGLKALAKDAGDEDQKVDKPAAGELRVLKVKRGSKRWEEQRRVRPSDLGFSDTY